jgi:hypothetical protein
MKASESTYPSTMSSIALKLAAFRLIRPGGEFNAGVKDILGDHILSDVKADVKQS